MIVPEIRYVPDGTGLLRFPFRRWLVDELKVMIPAWSRSYDPTKAWTVAPPYAARAAGLMRKHLGYVHIVDEPAAHSPFAIIWGRPGDPDLVILHLRDDALPELVEAAYRVLARLHHPDRGDTARMQELNAAYARLRDRREGGAA